MISSVHKIVRSLVGLPLPYHEVVGALLSQSQNMVIDASVGIIVVGEFRQVSHTLVRLLEDRNADGDVVGGLKILPRCILEVLLLDLREQFCVECTQVTRDEGILPVVVQLNSPAGEGTRVSYSSAGRQEI